MEMTRVAAIQMNSGDDVEANLRLTAQLVDEARSRSASIAVLPECFALMARDHQQRIESAEPGQGSGPVSEFLSGLAKSRCIWIMAAGIFTRCEQSRKVRNTCLLFNAEGNQVARYDKIHLFDIVLDNDERYSESDYTEPGDRTVAHDTPAGRAGITVCYDIRFPLLYRTLALIDAIWFAVPSAFSETTGRDHWEVLLRARAIENHAYVVAPAQWGLHPNGRTTYGNTMIIDPWGTVTAHRIKGDGVVVSEIHAARVAEIRNRFTKLYE